MAQTKKLVAEIDRTVKKVVEGIQIFDDRWEKLHAAGTQNLKERFQGELKTEIKKLQRLRDQIKTWQGMSDIRDKRSIDEARRNIETKMEQFKACEREAKIKTFSKIGLSQPTKEDPEEAARHQNRDWLNHTIDRLNMQIEQQEAELEGGQTRKAKRKNAKPLPENEAGKEKIREYRYHITKLEQLLRMLDNEQVAPDDIESIQELVTTYVERNGDPDYDPIEMDGVYDDIVPEDMDEVFPDTPTQPPVTLEKKTSEELPSSGAAPPTVKKKEKEKKKKEEGDKDSRAGTPTAPAVATPPSHHLAGKSGGGSGSAASTPTSSIPTASAAGAAAPVSGPAKTVAPQQNYAAVASKAQPKKGSTPSQPALDGRAVGGLPRTGSTTSTGSGAAPGSRAGRGKDSAPPSPAAPAAPSPTPGAGGSKSRGLHQQVQLPPPAAPTSAPSSGPSTPTASPARPDEQRGRVYRMLQQSADNLPMPEDTRKRQPYVPPNPYKTPSYYPQQPHPAFEQPENFSRFDTDTLFFVFYYQQSTYQQYLAAKELKKQSWRFHKKHFTWFQRADPPAVVNEDYEQGHYMYFDYEDGWQTRIRRDFSFKYCYLEDELPPLS